MKGLLKFNKTNHYLNSKYVYNINIFFIIKINLLKKAGIHKSYNISTDNKTMYNHRIHQNNLKKLMPLKS